MQVGSRRHRLKTVSAPLDCGANKRAAAAVDRERIRDNRAKEWVPTVGYIRSLKIGSLSVWWMASAWAGSGHLDATRQRGLLGLEGHVASRSDLWPNHHA